MYICEYFILLAYENSKLIVINYVENIKIVNQLLSNLKLYYLI